jgi:hypothetical protein
MKRVRLKYPLNNIPVLEISAEAGHSRVSTTTDIYGHYYENAPQPKCGTPDTKFAKDNIITLPKRIIGE